MKPNFDVEVGVPYLDNAVTTPISDEVLEAMLPYLQENYGDPSEPYGLGDSAKDALDDIREELADQVGAKVDNLWFTSGGTEANNWVVREVGVSGNVPLCSEVEHLSVVLPVQAAMGHVIGVDNNGQIDIDVLDTMLLSGKISLVSVQYANQDTGIKQNIPVIADICAKYEVPLHVDASIAFCVEQFDIEDLGIDFITLSSHKVWGPVGCGALVSNGKYPIRPFLLGGPQEGFMRAGAVNMAGIAGFGMASRIMRSKRDDWKKVESFRDMIELELKSVTNVSVVGKEVKRLGNMSMLSFPGSDAAFLAAEMERMHGMCVGIGSAAEPGSFSRVLKAMGKSRSLSGSTLRFRFGPWFNKAAAQNIIVSICSALREEKGRQIV